MTRRAVWHASGVFDDGNATLDIPAASGLTAHLSDTSDAHDASAISVADSGGYFAGTDVEAALQELGAGGGGGSVATDTIFDAKGDLPVGTGADTAAKLTVGSNGQVLTADSTQTTGIKWAASAGGGIGAVLYDYEVTGTDKTSIDTNVDGTTVANFAGYNVLEVFLYSRTDESAHSSSALITLNNDTGNNYFQQEVYGFNATAGAVTSLTRANWALSGSFGATAEASFFGLITITIPNYLGTVGYKTAACLTARNNATAADNQVEAFALSYKSTSAVSRLKATAAGASGKFKVGTRLLVYGR